MKKILVLFLMTIISFLFSACGGNKPRRVSAALVGGPIMNAPDYPLNAPHWIAIWKRFAFPMERYLL